MSTSFGPWCTAVGFQAGPQLNSFWKRRLAMLSLVSGSRLVMTRWKVGLLVVVAAAALAVPTFYGAPFVGALAGDGEGKAATGGSSGEETPEYLPRPSASELQILAALDKPTNIALADQALEEVTEILKQQHEINIWIDKNALTEDGIDPNQTVSLSLKGVRLRSALRLLLEPLNLMFMFEDEVLKITTRTKGGAKLVTRTYPVRDLCGEAKEFENLSRAIQQTIEPSSWDEAGGQGSVAVVPGSGSLVILQTYDVHAEVVQLLRTLREAKQKGASR